MKWARWFIFPALIVLLCVCVAGQSIRLAYVPPPAATEGLGIKVRVVCNDKRPLVLNGTKDPNYIGRYRAGFAVSWDVSTENKRPFAENLQRDVSNELAALGFDVVEEDAMRLLKVDIYDWDFDSYRHGKVWYRTIVSVETASGKRLARSNVEKIVAVEKSNWVGARYTFEREVPKIYQTAVDDMVRNNRQILAALESEGA